MIRIVPSDTAKMEYRPINRLSNRVAALAICRRIIHKTIELLA